MWSRILACEFNTGIQYYKIGPVSLRCNQMAVSIANITQQLT